MAAKQPSALFFYILLTASVVLLAAVIRPIGTALLLAAVLAGVLFPLQQRLTRWLRWKGVAAGAIVLAVVLVILGPIAAISAVAVSETTQGITFVRDTLKSEGVTGLVHKLPPSLQSLATSAWARFAPTSSGTADEAMTQQLNARTGGMAAMATTVAVWTGSFLFQSAMLLIALYFLLLDGPALIKWLDGVVPLKQGEFRELLAQFRVVSKAVIVSTAITAAIQAVAALGGFLIAKVPLPLFFAGLTFIFAFIPAIGASSVSILAAALLYFTGHPYMALFLAIWGLVVVGLIDNVVKPFLASGGMEMHGAIVFFSLVGGLAAFGAVGLIIGPLVASFFITLIRMYKRDYRGAAS